MGVTLFSDLQMSTAVRLARTVARDEHARSRRPVRVELHDAGDVLSLGISANDGGHSAAA